MNNHQNDIEELITRSLAGESSTDDEKKLSEWLAVTPDNANQFQKFKRIFELSHTFYAQKTNQIVNIDVDNEWKTFASRIEEKKVTPVRQLVPMYAPWLRIAAALLFISISGFVGYYFISQNAETVYQTANNTQEILLHDGSKVILNRHSELSFSKTFGEHKRILKLKGEGFFEVAHDASKPFIVETNQANVEVLGTSFSVQAYDNKKSVEVIVQTGIVKFSIPTEKREVKLLAGNNRGEYSKTNKTLTSVVNADVNFLSWKTQKMVFAGNDLKSVIDLLNKTYGVNIIISTTVSPTCAVTATFDQQALDAVLHVLETTLNLTIQKEGDRILIKAAGC